MKVLKSLQYLLVIGLLLSACKIKQQPVAATQSDTPVQADDITCADADVDPLGAFIGVHEGAVYIPSEWAGIVLYGANKGNCEQSNSFALGGGARRELAECLGKKVDELLDAEKAAARAAEETAAVAAKTAERAAISQKVKAACDNSALSRFGKRTSKGGVAKLDRVERALALTKSYDDFLAKQKQTLEESLAAFKAANPGKDFSSIKKQLDSIAHQEEILYLTEHWAPAVGLGDDLAKMAIRRGIHISDLGKLKNWAELLTKESEESTQLILFLQGKSADPKLAGLFNKLMETLGQSGKTFLPPGFSPDDVRAFYTQVPFAVGFNHELGGIIRAQANFSQAIKRGVKEADALDDAIAELGVNAFHNGPGSGFWEFLMVKLLPDSIEQLTDPKLKKFFEGTVFWNGTRIVYPLPATKGGVLHAIFDRTSQGTELGLIKILEEAIGFAKDKTAAVFGIFKDGGKGTISQLDVLLKHTSEKWPTDAAFGEMIGLMKGRVAEFNEFMLKKFPSEAELAKGLPEGASEVEKIEFLRKRIGDAVEEFTKLHGETKSLIPNSNVFEAFKKRVSKQ